MLSISPCDGSLPSQWPLVRISEIVRLSVKRRSVIQSPWYQQRWGTRVVMASDHNLKSEFANTRVGRMIATSVDATITGRGGNYILADDILNPSIAESYLERARRLS